MPTPTSTTLRAFVRRHTRLRAVPDVPGIRLHLADDVTRLWRLTGEVLDERDPALPYWAFAWSGGLAVARHLLDHPAEVVGRSVMDVGTGSGLCAIVAAHLGARSVVAVDIDPFAAAAAGLNARANGTRIAVRRADPLDGPPPDTDVLIAGDVCYEEAMAGRMLAWLERAAGGGSTVLLGDPGRTYAPRDLVRLGTYRVHASLEIEEVAEKAASVFAMVPAGTAMPGLTRSSHQRTLI